MGNSNDGDLVSLSGAPIFRHTESTPWAPPQGEECIEQISDHIETYLGKVETVFHEILSDTVHIDVHFVKPSTAFPFARLITSGMSDLPMSTPAEASVPQFAELMVTLPADWKLDQQSFKDEDWYWPVRLIKYLAWMPHKFKTWLGFGHSIPNGDPSQPYASNTKLCGSIVLPSITVPCDFHTLRIHAQKEITFYAVVPLYEEEMDLKLRSGTDELLERLGKRDITDIISLTRPNVAKKRFGFR